MSDPTDELVQFDAIIAQYCAELVRLNYVEDSINIYLRSIRRLFRLMGGASRSTRRDFYRHPQGSRRLPFADEQYCHRCVS